jgi:ubiquinone/menaquinone biosynthesis C-methylase UbiE
MSREMRHFQCPACAGRLASGAAEVVCKSCSGRSAVIDNNIVDFVGGRFDTALDPHQYDAEHGINDERSAADYRQIRRLLGKRWPASLGSMLEIGCGTGAISRAVLGNGDVKDAVLTDVSVDMLRICRTHLERVGVAARLPLTFATYSTNERCFRDASFDSCIGIQVLHHLPNYEAFLEDMFRFLKPGGVAFFAEPALRFHLALAAAAAEVIAWQMSRDPTPSRDRQFLHNWISEQRRGTLHQGALDYLVRLEDKHMFVPEQFAVKAQRIGFATAEAFPLAPDPLGINMARGLLGEIGMSHEAAAEVLELLPRHTEPYFHQLATPDRTPSYLFWLVKPVARRAARSRRTEAPSEPAEAALPATLDIAPAHWHLQLRAVPENGGLVLDVDGWCLLNADVKWLRIEIGGTSQRTAPWYPRPDVHTSFNTDGTYAAWNSLCCGVTDRLVFGNVPADAEELPMTVQFILTNGFCVNLPVVRFRPAEPMQLLQ